jgi:uncharacterized protein YdeI (BOF family)
MHKIIFLFISLLISSSALAQNSSQCGFIQDSDQQSLCRAIADSSPSQCGFISNSDLQSMCRGISGRQPSQCGFIQNSDQQSMCRAIAGGQSSQCGFIRQIVHRARVSLAVNWSRA